MLRAVGFVVVGAFTVIDAVGGPIFRPLAQWLARSSPIEWCRALARRMPSYVALVFLAVPLAIAEPAKVYGLYLIGEDKIIRGVSTIVAAYIVSLLLVDTIYDGARPQLRSIRWFAVVVDWIVTLRLQVLDAIRATRAWKRAQRIVASVRRSLRRGKEEI